MATKEKNYYKDLDIVRNISFIAVFLYHLGLLKGGYLAVCTFFTMSGYLSCISLFRKEKVSLLEYYKKRFIHIYLPFSIVVFLSILIISFISEINWINLKPETTSALLGYNNFWQLNANLDYFTRHVDSPFMHFWYISILLQFELVFPFIFIIFKKIGDNTKKFIPCILIGIICIASCIYFYMMCFKLNIMTVYYSTFTRMFSIFFGIFIGFVYSYYNRTNLKIYSNKIVSKIIFYIYLIILILLFIMIDSTSKLFPISMILVTLISCRLISYSTLINTTKLSVLDKIQKYFSNISYEIYLFQYPVIFIFQYIAFSNNLKIGLIIIITIILSCILHFSLNIKKDSKFKVLRIITCIIIMCFVSFGGYKYVIAKDHTEEMKQLENQLNENQNIMIEKQKEYALKLKEEEEKRNAILEELTNNENALYDFVHQIPVVGVGDSVMLGALSGLYQQFPNGYFDAKVSRTDYEANGILQGIKNQGLLGDVVIINLGTNGQCGARCRSVILNTIAGKKIFWINVTNDRDVHVNAGLKNFADENNNVYLIDWNSASYGHPEYFAPDGIHLTGAGINVYSKVIYDSIYNVYHQEYLIKKEQVLKDLDNNLNKKISFYGNEILLNSYNILQNTFKDYDTDFNNDNNKSFDIVINELKEKSKSNTFSKNIVFIFDNNTVISNEEYNELIDICKDVNLYIVFMNEVKFTSSDKVTIIDFSKDMNKNPNYLMVDRIHLSNEGNNALTKKIFDEFNKQKEVNK